jgi:hypothetical protein
MQLRFLKYFPTKVLDNKETRKPNYEHDKINYLERDNPYLPRKQVWQSEYFILRNYQEFSYFDF